jgi:hypothetical protein
MGKMDGTLDLHWYIIDATQCTSIKLEVNASTEVVMPFPTTTDLPQRLPNN